MSKRRLTPRETQYLQQALSADYKTTEIRLRKGEYQYSLAKAIASFQLNLYFPNAKEIVKRLYGTEKKESIQFRRRIQTILKKMERNNVVRILPKKKPWELQRYTLTSFKFRDVDKNRIAFATDHQLKQAQNQLNQEKFEAKPKNIKIEIFVLVVVVVVSYAAILWGLMQPTINLIIFIPAFSIAVACSLILGKTLAQKSH